MTNSPNAYTVRPRQAFSPDKIRQARTAAGISPEVLALKISRSVYSIHSYEIGRVSPPVDVVCLIAAALGVDVIDLFEEHA